MAQEYKINWCENKTTSTGKNKMDASIVGPDGVEQGGITIWDSFPGFADLRPGSIVKGDIIVKQNGKYTNKTLYPEREGNFAQAGVRKPASIAKAMETKAQNIEKAQERKESSIEKMAIFRDATLLTVAWVSKQAQSTIDMESIEVIWVGFHKWLQGKIDEPFI